MPSSSPRFASERLGIYISVPFCRSKCTYCNFASGVFSSGSHRSYVSRLIEDINGSAAWSDRFGARLPRTVGSIYLGGGTPSILAPELLRELFSALRSKFSVTPDAEVTLECAPGQLQPETLDALVECGVNRVSFGVQSFIDREAAASGRLHTRKIALEDLERARAAGLDNVNLDLIAGLPHQTRESWSESLDVLLASGVPHASVYMLEVDEDSRLGREILTQGGRYHAASVPSEEDIAAMYCEAIATLERAGLAQYEISNFAQTGSRSRHNLRYWQREPYLGLGLDASSMFPAHDGRLMRSTTTSDLEAYLAGPMYRGSDEEAEWPEIVWLDREQQLEEAWFLGLRLNDGVSLDEIKAEFGDSALEQACEPIDRLTANGLLEHTGGRLRLTGAGRLLSNEVFTEFMSDRQPSERDHAVLQVL